MQNSAAKLVIKIPDVVERSNPDGSISIVNLSDERYLYTINGVATEVWSMLGELTIEEIELKIQKRYGIQRSRVSRDVRGLLKTLKKFGLIL